MISNISGHNRKPSTIGPVSLAKRLDLQSYRSDEALMLQASSRCGTPDELKAMIDEAHHLGLTVRF